MGRAAAWLALGLSCMAAFGLVAPASAQASALAHAGEMIKQEKAAVLTDRADELCTAKPLLALATSRRFQISGPKAREAMVLRWLREREKGPKEDLQTLSELVAKRLDDLLEERRFRKPRGLED